MTDSEALRDLAETLDGCEWNHPLGSADLCRRVADEIERLTSLLTSCRSDTDIEDVGYPRTANDVLSLLSAYIVDVMPDPIPGDEYFGAWERLARPVIERLTSSSDERLKAKLDACISFIENEMKWCHFREEFFEDNVSVRNARKLEEFLDKLEASDAH